MIPEFYTKKSTKIYKQPFKIVSYSSNLAHQTDHPSGLYFTAILSSAYTYWRFLLAGLAVLSFLRVLGTFLITLF